MSDQQVGSALDSARVSLLALVLVALGTMQQVRAQDTAAAVATVETLHAALIENMKSTSSSPFEARHATMREVVDGTFYFPAIVRAVLGRHYEAASEAQRDELGDLLARLSAASYVARFDSFDGERFENLETRPVRGARVLVRTRLVRNGNRNVSFDYLVQSTPEGPRIVNVIADGVSDLSLKRAQYASVIRREGLPRLLERVEQQVMDLLQEARSTG